MKKYIKRNRNSNRKFILVQLPEAVESKEYKTIDEIGRKRIELSAQKIKKEHPEYTGDLGFKHYTIKEVDADTIANMEEFDPNKNVVNIPRARQKCIERPIVSLIEVLLSADWAPDTSGSSIIDNELVRAAGKSINGRAIPVSMPYILILSFCE